VSYDSLNHVHDVGCISITLKRAHRYFLDFIPNKMKHTKVKFVGARNHSQKEISIVGSNDEAISFPRNPPPPKKMIQVSIEGK
jgi:hypothetical protein